MISLIDINAHILYLMLLPQFFQNVTEFYVNMSEHAY